MELTKEFISDIIDAGADASKNLFTVDFYEGNLSTPIIPRARIKEVGIYSPGVKTVNLSYLNTDIIIPTKTGDIKRFLTLRARMDESYMLYRLLKPRLGINEDGSSMSPSSLSKFKPLDIVITSYKPTATTPGTLQGVMQWKFFNCKPLNAFQEQVQFNYDPSTIDLFVKFIFLRMESSPVAI